MAEKEDRWRRPEPERTEPDRGSPGGPSGDPSARSRRTSHDWDDEPDDSPYDWAEDGMSAAHRVVEEHLRARRHAQGWYEPRGGGQSPFGYRYQGGGRGEGTIEQMMRLYLDLMNFVISMIGAGPLGRMYSRGGEHYPAPELHRHDRLMQVSIETISKKTTRTTLDLEAPRHARLFVRALDAIHTDNPPIDDVWIRFRNNRPTLRIVIPDDQPDGVYTGTIVDRETHEEEYGTLTVRVGDPVRNENREE